MAKASSKAAPKQRRTVSDATQSLRSIAGQQGEESETDVVDEDLVMVDVPRAFILTDDGRVEHRYGVGGQKMPRSHAEHDYAKAHGVTIVDEA